MAESSTGPAPSAWRFVFGFGAVSLCRCGVRGGAVGDRAARASLGVTAPIRSRRTGEPPPTAYAASIGVAAAVGGTITGVLYELSIPALIGVVVVAQAAALLLLRQSGIRPSRPMSGAPHRG